jgi:hypothetical protein
VVDVGILTRFWSALVSKITGKRPGEIKKRWVFDSNSSILASATIHDIDDDGRQEIIFGTKDGYLYVLSDSGKIKWKASLRAELGKVKSVFVEQSQIDSINGSPIIGRALGKKIVVACTAAGVVAAFNNDGTQNWIFQAGGGIYQTPLYADIDDDGRNEIIFGSSDKHLYALSTLGALIWKYDSKSVISSPPALYNWEKQFIMFGTETGYVKAVSTTGKFKWKFQTGGKISAKPVVNDIYNDKNPRIIVGSGDKSLYVLDQHGKLDWQYKTHGGILSEVRLADIDNDNEPEIFFGACDDNLYALAPNSQKIWSYETDFWIVAPPIITDIDDDGASEVIAGSYDKSLYVFEGKGTFSLNYLPGLSVIINQPGHFTPFITSQPGELVGKKLWQLKLGSEITGVSLLEHDNLRDIIVSTKDGRIVCAYHEK